MPASDRSLPIEIPPETAPAASAALEDQPAPAGLAPQPVQAQSHSPASAGRWREDLSGRVEKFRRRRSRLRGGFDPSTTLDLEFDADEDGDAATIDATEGGRVIEFGEMDRELNPLTPRGPEEDLSLDVVPLEIPGDGIRILSGAAVQAGEMSLSHQESQSEPVEIVIDSVRSAGRQSSRVEPPSFEPRALIGRRLLAGLADALILLVGSGVFAAIFWAICLRYAALSLRAANVGALGLIASFLVLFYFGMSVSLTASTPGLAWMGLEIRNLDGGLPTSREALWRAFGYLVSASALFLGFIWALLDADGLTWHDLMSETYVAEKDS